MGPSGCIGLAEEKRDDPPGRTSFMNEGGEGGVRFRENSEKLSRERMYISSRALEVRKNQKFVELSGNKGG